MAIGEWRTSRVYKELEAALKRLGSTTCANFRRALARIGMFAVREAKANAPPLRNWTNTDLVRISTGGDPDCPYCSPWEGVIVSISGKTKGLPTYDDARNAGCFHPNCTHTLEYVDETADADEIALQQQHPVTGDPTDPDAQDERKYQIDQARKMRDNPGMTKEEARVAVDRDNLALSIQSGLVRDDAREIVAKMTDAQVSALCPNGNPPAFEPTKRIKGGTRKEPKHEPERWNHGRRGGVVHIQRGAGLEQLLEVCKATDTDLTLAKARDIEKAGASDGKTLTLAPIDKATAQEIKAVCGVAPKTLTPTVGGNEIRHTFNRHGKHVEGKTKGEAQKNQVPITADDIAKISEILKSHDSIERGSPNVRRGVSTESVKFEKKYSDGTTYTVFAVANNLQFRTMWKKK